MPVSDVNVSQCIWKFSLYNVTHNIKGCDSLNYKQRGGVLQVTTPDDLLVAERMLSMSSGKSSSE